MKKLLLAICLVIMLLSGCGKKQDDVIEIGCIAPFSGDNARYGELVQGGVEIALKEITNGGGINGRKVMVIYEDSQMKPEIGVNAINHESPFAFVIPNQQWDNAATFELLQILQRGQIEIHQAEEVPYQPFRG